MTPSELLATARWKACRAVPYFARAIWAMSFVPDGRVPTIAIDKQWRVYYSPSYVEECAKEGTLIAELIHEALHPSMRHPTRETACNATDHAHWNACGDAEIDQQIEAMRDKQGNALPLVKNRVTPADLGGKPGQVAEELYKLPREQSPKSAKCHCSGGSGTGNSKPAWEKDADAKASQGEGPAGLSEAEAALIRSAIAGGIVAASQSKGRDTVPAGLLRWAETEVAPPPVDWRSLIVAKVRYMLAAKRGSHPTYARPSRRHVPGGFVLPVYRSPIPNIVIVLDTSGSMGDADLATCIATVADACLVLGRVTAIAVGAAASEAVSVQSADDLREAMRGGGGTDMRVGIRKAEETNPDAIVVVTDGDTPWPDSAPDAALTVVLTRPNPYSQPPAWADCIVAAQ